MIGHSAYFVRMCMRPVGAARTLEVGVPALELFANLPGVPGSDATFKQPCCAMHCSVKISASSMCKAEHHCALMRTWLAGSDLPWVSRAMTFKHSCTVVPPGWASLWLQVPTIWAHIDDSSMHPFTLICPVCVPATVAPCKSCKSVSCPAPSSVCLRPSTAYRCHNTAQGAQQVQADRLPFQPHS